MEYPEYAGMSYEQVSRKAHELIAMASETGRVFDDLPERLSCLKAIARMHTGPLDGDKTPHWLSRRKW